MPALACFPELPLSMLWNTGTPGVQAGLKCIREQRVRCPDPKRGVLRTESLERNKETKNHWVHRNPPSSSKTLGILSSSVSTIQGERQTSKNNFLFKEAHPWLPVNTSDDRRTRLWRLQRVFHGEREQAGHRAQLVRCDHCSESHRRENFWGWGLLSLGQTKRPEWLALLWAPNPAPSHSSHLSPPWVTSSTGSPVTPAAMGEGRTEFNTSPPSEVYAKGRQSGSLPSGCSGVGCQPLQTSPALQLHRERKSNCSLESPELFPLIGFSPFLIQMSAAPGCLEPPLKFLCGAIPWSLFFPAQETELSQPWAPFAFLLWRIGGSLLSHTIFSHSNLLDCLWDKYCC